MKKLVTWMVVAGVTVGCVGGLWGQSPKFRKLVGTYLPGIQQSTEPAVSRIQDYEVQLQANLNAFQQMRDKVQTQLTEQIKVHQNREGELLGVLALLARFKDEYGVGIGPGGFPRQILGRSYSKDAIESQVELLLKRRAELDEQASHYTAVTTKLQKSLSDLDQRIGTTKTHLESMPTYVTLVESHALTGQSDRAVSGLESCLASNEALLTATVRDSTELLKAARDERNASIQNNAVRQFLTSGTDAAPAAGSSSDVPMGTGGTQGSAQAPASAGKVPCPASTKELLSQIKAILESPAAATAN